VHESACGTKPTCRCAPLMSDDGGEADVNAAARQCVLLTHCCHWLLKDSASQLEPRTHSVGRNFLF
jgi:hypothetical protein